MSSFQINAQDPPNSKSVPRQEGYIFHRQSVIALDGLGKPIVKAEALPWVELYFRRLNEAGWNWYCSFLDASHRMYGELTSVRTINPYNYTVPGGPNWETFSGAELVLEAPTFEGISFGHYFGVRVVIRGLS